MSEPCPVTTVATTDPDDDQKEKAVVLDAGFDFEMRLGFSLEEKVNSKGTKDEKDCEVVYGA